MAIMLMVASADCPVTRSSLVQIRPTLELPFRFEAC